MDIEFYVRIPEEKLGQLLPALREAGAMPENDIAAIEWEDPKEKMSVYQVVVGDNLETMAEGFNEMLAEQGLDLRLRDTLEMDVTERYRMLRFLCGNARWDRDSEFSDSWLADSPNETKLALELRPELTEPAK